MLCCLKIWLCSRIATQAKPFTSHFSGTSFEKKTKTIIDSLTDTLNFGALFLYLIATD